MLAYSCLLTATIYLTAVSSFSTASTNTASTPVEAAKVAEAGKRRGKRGKHAGKRAQATTAPAPEVAAPPPESEPASQPESVAEPVPDAQADAVSPSAAQPVASPPATQAERLEELSATSPGESPPASASGLAQAVRIAVYDFELQGIEPNIGHVVTDSALAEVRKLQGVSAIGMDEIRDMLSHEANKQILGCESNESCLAEIAGALGVDELISGQLSKVDDGTVFVMRRIDQRRAKVIGVVNKRLTSGSGEEFLAAIGPAVEELFPKRSLREGLERGVPKEMALRLNPPPLPSWTTIAVGGTAAAVAIAGGVFGLLANEAQHDYTSFAKSGVGAVVPISGADLMGKRERLVSRVHTANALFISAGAMALSAGIMALFTDWYGYAAEGQVSGP